jgi:hypothetical protein
LPFFTFPQLKASIQVGVYQIPATKTLAPSEEGAESGLPDHGWRVVAAYGQQTLAQNGHCLADLCAEVLQNSCLIWPSLGAIAKLKQKPIFTVLVLSNQYLNTFRLPCEHAWGPRDIEAECWLEASAILQLPMPRVAMDYEVRLSSNADVFAQLIALDKLVVNAYVDQMKALGLSLQVLTSQSESNSLSQFEAPSVNATEKEFEC